MARASPEPQAGREVTGDDHNKNCPHAAPVRGHVADVPGFLPLLQHNLEPFDSRDLREPQEPLAPASVPSKVALDQPHKQQEIAQRERGQ